MFLLCLKHLLSAPSLQVHFPAFSFLFCVSFFLFHVLQVSFLSPALPALSRQWPKNPNI